MIVPRELIPVGTVPMEPEGSKVVKDRANAGIGDNAKSNTDGEDSEKSKQAFTHTPVLPYVPKFG